ncbi:alpha/beta hydrolase [Selenomonas sp.]|uniref:alpha/beta hydrolase n=1 Tax=Selenomonas sp. TaxID=2053611 RepID=UPI0025DC704C|nr:alpha/beta hydrolase [Selenomonas sp.]MCI6283525.1 alpha/beta hydrolase [Selenomonas sp.]
MDLMSWDAAQGMDLINKPLLMMAGSAADTLYMTEDAFAKATGTNDKELFLVKGATHIKTYWVPEYVDQEVNELTKFLSTRL